MNSIRCAISIAVTLMLASVARAQDLTPMVNDQTLRVTRYNLAQLESPTLKRWVADRLSATGAPQQFIDDAWTQRHDGLSMILDVLHAGPSIGHTLISLTPAPVDSVWLAFPVTPQQQDNVAAAMEAIEHTGFRSGFFVLTPLVDPDETISTPRLLNSYKPSPRPELLALLPKEPPLLASVMFNGKPQRDVLAERKEAEDAGEAAGPPLSRYAALASARLIMTAEPEVTFSIELTPAPNATAAEIKALWPQLAIETFSDLRLDPAGLIIRAIAALTPIEAEGKLSVTIDNARIDQALLKLLEH